MARRRSKKRKAIRRRLLTVEQVLEARLRYAWGERDLTPMSQEFGARKASLARAVVGDTYRKLPMPPRDIVWARWRPSPI